MRKSLQDKNLRSSDQIGVVDEEEDYAQDSSQFKSEGTGSSKKYAKDSSRLASSQVDQSGELEEAPPSPPKEVRSELTDREITMSTTSVDWQISLQARQGPQR